MCMKEPLFMMSLLILGPHQPGNDIDVYLQPLIDELMESWENGVETYDACSKESFEIRVAVLWTINDFPAYGNLSGWTTKGYKACPACNEDSLRLRRKIGYTWRRCKDFSGKYENRVKSLELPPMEKIQAQLERLPDTRFRKYSSNKKDPVTLKT
ncbi:hypothetical protein AAC387_Pa09g0997 [Persea americana]